MTKEFEKDDNRVLLVAMDEAQGSWPFLLMSVLEGTGSADGYPLKKGDHFIVPCGYGNLRLEGTISLMASAPGKIE